MKRKLQKILKRQIVTALQNAYYFPLDIIDSIIGKRDKFTPPRRLIFVGDGDFRKWGDEFFKYFLDLGGLKPTHKVLDVGCGIGRMAIPLTKYLTSGSYNGFDIIYRGIKWCNKTISPEYPNFHFHLADVYNEWYNPTGKYKASDYKFPYQDKMFDFVFLTSVFTHLLPLDMENYFSEISRVLKSKGKVLITFFVMTNDSKKLIEQNFSKFRFKNSGENYWTISQSKPESAVAYEEEYIKNLFKKNKMSIIEPVHYGSWSGRKDYLSFQDIIVAEKI